MVDGPTVWKILERSSGPKILEWWNLGFNDLMGVALVELRIIKNAGGSCWWWCPKLTVLCQLWYLTEVDSGTAVVGRLTRF